MRFLLVTVLLTFIVIGSGAQAAENAGLETFIEDTARAGHRDIICETSGDTLIVSYWPMGFRDDFRAYRDIQKRLLSFLDSRVNGIKQVRLVQTSWGIPAVTTYISRSGGSMTPAFKTEFRHPLAVNHTKRHYPARRFNLLFGLPLVMNFGGLYDPLIFKTGVYTDLRISLFPGTLFYNQVNFYVYNDYDKEVWYEPANVGIVIARALSGKMLSLSNIGYFNRELFGIDEEIVWHLSGDRWLLRVHGGYYGDMRFIDNQFRFNHFNKHMALAGIAYAHQPYDLTLELFGGRFLYGDVGIGAKVSRLFGEVEIGIEGIHSERENIGYVSVALPLFPLGRKSVARSGVGLSRHYHLRYRYNSETIIHEQTNRINCYEPVMQLNYRSLMGFSSPVHFRYMSEYYPKHCAMLKDNQ